jgi:hypothetical protein
LFDRIKAIYKYLETFADESPTGAQIVPGRSGYGTTIIAGLGYEYRVQEKPVHHRRYNYVK